MVEPVYLEVGKRRVFACALDWPGWCRSGKDEKGALESLAACAPRYAQVAAAAGLDPPTDAGAMFEVVERIPGSATTDFGAPGVPASGDIAPVAAGEAEKAAALLRAAWDAFDRIATAAPEALRKGPRGGGRDTSAIVAHVVGAEVEFARKLDLRLGTIDSGDPDAVAAGRRALLERVAVVSSGEPYRERGWPPRFAVRRIVWHVLDHAWEIEDRAD